MILKKDKLDLIKIKNFCSLKNITKRLKRQITGKEKMFANYIPKTELVLE